MKFIVIVPARLESTRLPRKPLADVGGVPMVVRVARNAAASGAARVVVAVDDPEIDDACRRHHIESIVTCKAHQSGTDRIAEAAQLLGLDSHTIVVNVQADEPLLPPAVVRDVAQLVHDRADCEIGTAAHPIEDAGEFFNPDVVKVVFDANGRALMFSRAPIPWSRDAFAASRSELPVDLPAWRHVGLYAYRVAFLTRFPSLPPVAIEQHEKLEQLRALAHGVGIAVLRLACALPPGVDTAEDLHRVRALIRD